jgi:hypothetical protein
MMAMSQEETPLMIAQKLSSKMKELQTPEKQYFENSEEVLEDVKYVP